MTQAPRALVVEDDRSWQEILSEILSDCGLEVDIAASVETATACLKTQPHRVAVIDLSLSPNDHNNVDGLRMLDTIRRLDPNCRTILLTGFATVELAVADLSLQGTNFINWEKETSDSEPEGYRLLKTAQTDKIPTIVVSGITEPEEIQRIYAEHSIAAYIEKQSFERAAFLRVVEETRQARVSQAELSALTDREREVLNLLAEGLTNKEIAQKLVITTNTVKRHIKAIFEKLDVHTRSAATARVAGDKKFKSL
jgi:DNA-binding NarL/FixJ family response regulator